jgi:hypothetical protein
MTTLSDTCSAQTGHIRLNPGRGGRVECPTACRSMQRDSNASVALMPLLSPRALHACTLNQACRACNQMYVHTWRMQDVGIASTAFLLHPSIACMHGIVTASVRDSIASLAHEAIDCWRARRIDLRFVWQVADETVNPHPTLTTYRQEESSSVQCAVCSVQCAVCSVQCAVSGER